MTLRELLQFCFLTIMMGLPFFHALAQQSDSSKNEIGENREPVKVLHAEPLYIDLIRDLGARKGEREWNVGVGLTDNNKFDTYTVLVEYEFAPLDRLGFEVELPFSFYYRHDGEGPDDSVPSSGLNSLKLASQYTFFVSEPLKTSMAIGYIHEFEVPSFREYGKSRLWRGNVYNPFLVAAKRWKTNFHTLIYAGPYISKHIGAHNFNVNWQINSSFHYMISGTRNFIGVEYNKEFSKNDFDMTIRPQLRLSVADNFLVGIVVGVPVSREKQRFSTFARVIYEPRHKHM